MGSGRTMDGALRDGFEWLLEQIYCNYDELEKRVNEALEELKRRQNEERIRRQHHFASTISSSSTSEEQINDTGTKVPVVAKPNADDMKGINENAFINHSTVTSHRNTNTNQIINDDKGSERKRHLRNTISPTNELPFPSIDSTKMKYPQIFEVKKLLRRRQEKKTASVQTDGIFDVNGDLQSQPTSKPTRITQLVPLTVIPKERPKRPIRPLRRTDSI